MRFSAAIEFCIYRNKKIRRTGWNGRSQYVILGKDIAFLEPNDKCEWEICECDKALIFHGTSGIQVGWLASQGDMLADDWEVI